ncbi:hypothetical protein AIOL_004719 [Candidatus Rhodobacter oscarellae]|uniref:DUF4198 domain-containing protein n=1 Tax=Candidatus Rhodobacter oscarellae TaxID=1675527 RepID=A0A0J9EAT9_9RHOB|nr:hypothetical protein AIOL_004719 [Candidatus Rhodobacter lobularis]
MFVAAPIAAHEFWISPKDYIIDPQDQLVADIRVGQDFKGNASGYLPPRFVRFDLVQGDDLVPVEGAMGDRPALQMQAPGEGLVTVVYQTTDSRLTYSEWEKFVNFVTHKDLAWALEEHAERGLPQTGFREVYSRYGKSLMAVGAGAGADQEVGLLTEIVSLANPYTDPLPQGLPVRVLYEGAPRAFTQIEVFQKAPDDTVSVATYRTDAAGVANVPVKPGHEYLVDSVVIRGLVPEAEGDPVWESLWASLTFEFPAE